MFNHNAHGRPLNQCGLLCHKIGKYGFFFVQCIISQRSRFQADPIKLLYVRGRPRQDLLPGSRKNQTTEAL